MPEYNAVLMIETSSSINFSTGWRNSLDTSIGYQSGINKATGRRRVPGISGQKEWGERLEEEASISKTV